MSLSRATWLVARREFSERIRSRAFQISMLVTVLVVAAVGIIAGVVNDDGRVASMKAYWEPDRTMASFTSA